MTSILRAVSSLLRHANHLRKIRYFPQRYAGPVLGPCCRYLRALYLRSGSPNRGSLIEEPDAVVTGFGVLLCRESFLQVQPLKMDELLKWRGEFPILERST